MATIHPKVEKFLQNAEQWHDEFEKLRDIIIELPLKEDFKWNHPCYTFQESNIVLIHGFNDYCALLFHKGALLKDLENLLIQQTENVQAARQLRFTGLQEIITQEAIIKAYIEEAIEVEKSGLEIEFKDTSEYSMPDELVARFEEDPDYENAFYALTPGRQRGYLLHFSSAKQSATRTARIEKYRQKIFDGKGYNER